jgi:RHS repeat-associated protein
MVAVACHNQRRQLYDGKRIASARRFSASAYHRRFACTWDVRNRLSEVTTRATAGGPATSIVDYLYDAENRWVGENIDSTGDGQINEEIRFAYDGDQIVLEFDKDLSRGASPVMTASDLSHRYLWGPTVDQLLADEQLTPVTETSGQATGYDLAQPGTVVWAFTDDQNTVRDLAIYSAQAGVTSIVNHREFDSFGNLLSQTNPATGSAATVDCLFGFTGFAFDQASGTWRSQTRPYNPATGRWIQKDLIGFSGGDTNAGRYCGNSPTSRIDPTGRWTDDAKRLISRYQLLSGIFVDTDHLVAAMIIESLIQSNGNVMKAWSWVLEVRGDSKSDNDVWASIDHFFQGWGVRSRYDNAVVAFVAADLANIVYSGLKLLPYVRDNFVPRDPNNNPPSALTFRQYQWGNTGAWAAALFSHNLVIGSPEWRQFLSWLDSGF